MILFDPDQPEAANGFPQLASSTAGTTSRPALPSRPTLTRYLRQAQTAVGMALRKRSVQPLQGEVTVLLTTDEGIRGLNRRFRKKNKPTDVLSFPVDDHTFGQSGDLAISVDTAMRQATEHGHKLSIELRVLMLHGLLHLAGLDHEVDHGKMAQVENSLRAELGLPSGLIERTVARSVQPRRKSLQAPVHKRDQQQRGQNVEKDKQPIRRLPR